MSINTNNTDIREVYANGVRMEKVYFNDGVIHTKMNGAVTMVATGSGSASFASGEEDIDRHFVIVSGVFSSNGVGPSPVPIVNGTSCTTILNDVDNGNDDGGRCGVFTIKIPTGVGTFNVTNCDSVFAVYRVVGINTMTAYSTAGNSGDSSISILAPAKGVTFAIGVRNFNTAVALSGTNGDLSYAPGNPAVGGVRNDYAAPTAITIGNANYSQMMRAVSFAYDVYA
jgi:hypothetical protein